jgi:hypothetical protein
MITTIHAYAALVTSVDKNGVERNFLLKRPNRSSYRIHHKGFLSVYASQISREEYEFLGIPIVSDRDVDLNDMYNV